jgi:hypothetical protein
MTALHDGSPDRITSGILVADHLMLSLMAIFAKRLHHPFLGCGRKSIRRRVVPLKLRGTGPLFRSGTTEFRHLKRFTIKRSKPTSSETASSAVPSKSIAGKNCSKRNEQWRRALSTADRGLEYAEHLERWPKTPAPMGSNNASARSARSGSIVGQR